MTADDMGRRTAHPVESEPQVSIVIAAFNDAEYIVRAIESALSQTLGAVEVICVDDASTDNTVAVIRSSVNDGRFRLLQHEQNRSAFEARRTGVAAARSPYVLFLDGDDELAPGAAASALNHAHATGADVVGFGVRLVMPEGRSAPTFERSLQPRHKELLGEDIIPGIFPEGQVAQGHLWKYLFSTPLLRRAYDSFISPLALRRANDLPLTFRTLALARKYASLNAPLYHYYFGLGKSGQHVATLEEFEFYLGAIDSVELICPNVPIVPGGQEQLHSHEAASRLQRSARNARLSVIGNILRYLVDHTPRGLQSKCLAVLVERVGVLSVILGAADFCPDALDLLVNGLALVAAAPDQGRVQGVLITTANLSTGGVQGVVASQAAIMRAEGLNVTLGVHSADGMAQQIGEAVPIELIEGPTRSVKIERLLGICRRTGAGTVIDHHILYNENWPFYALAARAAGVRMIGWIHNFALRPVFDGTSRLSFLRTTLPLLHGVVVLTAMDALLWRSWGVSNVVAVTNPPSALARQGAGGSQPKALRGARLELMWWGRLQERTKQVSQLVEVARQLDARGVPFRLTVIGPDGPDMTLEDLAGRFRSLGLSDKIDLTGPLHDEALYARLTEGHVHVSTSAIEGSPLTLVEAQAFAMPVVMYQLPWLTGSCPDTDGVLTVAQGDIDGLVDSIERFARVEGVYERASQAALLSAQRAMKHDLGTTYRDLARGVLVGDIDVSKDDPVAVATALDLCIAYAERASTTRTESTRPYPKTTAAAVGAVQFPIPGIEEFQQYRRRQGGPLRKVLTAVLPSSWRQANVLAERQARWSHAALSSVTREQRELNARMSMIVERSR